MQSYANNKYATIPRQISILEKLKGQLTIECDELWSFVFSKINKVDIWLAINRKTREIVDFYGGDRKAKSAQKRWESLPGVYRQCAVRQWLKESGC